MGNKETAKQTDCPSSSFDRCVNETTNGVTAYSCNSKSTLDAAGATDGGCKDANGIKVCVCRPHNCNKPTPTSTDSTSTGKLLLEN